MASSQSLENKDENLLPIIFSLIIKNPETVLYSRSRKIQETESLNECSSLYYRENIDKNLLRDLFNGEPGT